MKAPRAERAWAAFVAKSGNLMGGSFGTLAVYPSREAARSDWRVIDGYARVIPVRIVPVIRGKASKGKRRKK